MRLLRLFGVFAVVVLAGLVLGWWNSRGPTARDLSAASLSDSPPEQRTEVTWAKPADASIRDSQEAVSRTGADAAVGSATATIAWEEQMIEVLSSDGDEAAKAKELLELFPVLPAEGQAQAAQYLSHLLPDRDFGALCQEHLLDSATPDLVQDVLLAGLLSRRDAVKLPLLLEVARNAQNVKAPEAEDLLKVLLQEDYGNDWTKWQAKVDQSLKAKGAPDEER